jgi:hypothetical protein
MDAGCRIAYVIPGWCRYWLSAIASNSIREI